jgi:pyruvate,water dikinase
MKYIKLFENLCFKDAALVGGKNASLGEMIAQLTQAGVRVPHGFAVTVQGYWNYMTHNKLTDVIQQANTDFFQSNNSNTIRDAAQELRSRIEKGEVPDDLGTEIVDAYHQLSMRYCKPLCDVAVRSSATAEDLAYASFAGQQDSFLNISGDEELIEAYKKCIASLFTDRAITYRSKYGLDPTKIALSVGVQKMVRADLSSAGVAFSLDTETGFKDVVMIEGSYGLGEAIVQGLVTPDSFLVHKPTLQMKYTPILKKQLGKKVVKMIYASHKNGLETVAVDTEEQGRFVL